MSSWFSDLTESVKGVTESVAKAVENVELPTIDQETLQKLTLTTPELLAEKQALEQSETRKQQVKDMLASLQVWNTRDEDRSILVEECKEAILKLSLDPQTFFGPFQMPESTVKTTKEKTEEEKEEDLLNDTVEEDESTKGPTKAQLEQLEKLHPLPDLLENFDLDAHVGLIENLLKEDPLLVEQQSKLGGGARENIFWKNYFFHCAFTRYECGLSVDEIWCPEKEDATTSSAAASIAEAVAAEETIVFEEQQVVAAAAAAAATEPVFANESAAGTTAGPAAEVVPNPTTATPDSPSQEYAFVTPSDLAGGEAELDDLEAEIMKELED